VQRPLGVEVEAALQARKNADEQIVQACEALGLGIDQIAPSSNQQPDLKVELGGGFDRPQLGAGANLVGDGACIARVGLVLAADRALTSAIDGQAGHVDQGESGRGPPRRRSSPGRRGR
jgi:hypothetical protein